MSGPQKDWIARFLTPIGEFSIRADAKRAPQTSAYFRALIEAGAFEGASIFRIVNSMNASIRAETPIHVIQGGRKEPDSPFAQTISHEHTDKTGLRHLKWTVSAAREGVGEVYASFFICMRDESVLDFHGSRHPDGQGFAAFGQVIDGFDTLGAIFDRAEDTEYVRSEIMFQSVKIKSLK